MKRMPHGMILALLGLLALGACAGARQGGSPQDEAGKVNLGYTKQDRQSTSGAISETPVEGNYDASMTMADVLRRTPGLQVVGQGSNAKVFIRGITTNTGVDEPLFVVDGSIMGKSFQSVANFPVIDVARITVLRDVATANIYGLNGSNGVVLIETKRGN